ncbi:MAG: hypothetical protein JXA78_17315 [Anaerolineales bacterium]|nr:hypothetical protein [Anaerolineales bacterium]
MLASRDQPAQQAEPGQHDRRQRLGGVGRNGIPTYADPSCSPDEISQRSRPNRASATAASGWAV